MLDHSCKCGGTTYCVPQADDVPLVLRNLTAQDIRVLRPLVIHCGEYTRVVHGYRQRTGPFRVSWSSMSVQDKIAGLDDARRRDKLQRAYDYLMCNRDSAYSKFVLMQQRGVREPFAHEVFTAPDFEGVKCALWPTLYYSSKLCETLLEGQSNRASSKISYMHKVLSPVVDYCMDFELLQFSYDRWLFKTVTGAINSSKASGCSPNCGLQQKSFSATFWRWQHLLLIDAVRQYGFPSFVTISPYEWSFPWPGFIEKIRQQQSLEPTDLPVLETLHVAHVLEQIARAYLAGANTNRWRQNVFGNSQHPMERNVITYFYRFEFQSRGTLHLHMLVWVKDLALIRANLLRASIPWGNVEDAFLVADIQKSSSSCLPLFEGPDCFEQREDGSSTLRFHYGEEDSARSLRAFVTTLLGALRCRSDVQVADGWGMLLKYVSSYVTKMHESATSEGLYCTDVTGYQAANSFLRTVRPLAPEMAFQLNYKIAWTDKMTRNFTPPHPGQEQNNVVYQLYLRREPQHECMSLLEWLRCHTVVGKKAKSLGADKFLVGVKFLSVQNPVFFFQHLLVHHPHRSPSQLRHLEEATMPPAIRHFSQAIQLCPERWSTSCQILQQFDLEGHRNSYLSTLVAFVLALHDIYFLWQ